MTNTILFFSSTSCGPCRLAKSLITENFLQENNIELKHVLAEENFAEFATWQVANVPTFILTKEGKELKRKVGFKSLQDIKDLLT